MSLPSRVQESNKRESTPVPQTIASTSMSHLALDIVGYNEQILSKKGHLLAKCVLGFRIGHLQRLELRRVRKGQGYERWEAGV